MTTLKVWLVAFVGAVLVGCGGGGGSAGTSPFGTGAGSGTGSGSGSGSGSGGGTATASALAMSVKLLDASGQVTSSVLAGQPVRAQAVLTKNGQPVPDAIVQFTLDQTVDIVKLDPTSGSLLTDASGTAIITVSSLGSATGAGTVRASSSVDGLTATSGANFFSSGSAATTPTTLTLSGLEIGSPSVSAYGTTGVKVRVLQAGVPFTSAVAVNFTSSCAAGKATITPNTTTQADGYAVATFVDNGCAPTADSTITITASISTDSKAASLVVKAPTTGSLRFLTVVPSDKSITLKGQGGNGRQENATVTFQLVDVAGNGVGNADVCFDVTTYIGGLNLDGFAPGNLPSPQGSTALCGTDSLSVVRYVKRTNADGTVAVQINSGTVPTPVRVRARTLYPTTAPALLETFSDSLSISTGLPMQRSFSLSVDKANIDGGDFDGEIATLTIRLADQFSNPVPDGTVVNFISSGAAVCTANNGSCKTTNGACSCSVVSQERRPLDRRVVVTAYAVGLEDFDDSNGDNLYTLGEKFYDLGDAYVDANKDGRSNSLTINADTDILIPYQQNNVFKATGDGVRGTAHIRASSVIYLSMSTANGNPTAVIPLSALSQSHSLATGLAVPGYFVRLKPVCPKDSPVPQATISLALEDGLGNPMAAGTTLAAVDASSNITTGGFRPAAVLALGARSPFALIDNPVSNRTSLAALDGNAPKDHIWTTADDFGNVVTGHSVVVKGVEDKCSGTASFALEVASPRGAPRTANLVYEDETRAASRSSFDVRYVERVEFVANPGAVGTKQITVVPDSWVAPVGAGSTLASATIAWGDGNSDADVSLPIGSVTHTYAASGVYTVSITVTATDGTTYSASKTVIAP